MRLSAAVSRVIRKLQRKRRDFDLFAGLVDTPGDLAVGFDLPANGYFYVSTSQALLASTPLIISGGLNLGAPISDANELHAIGMLERGRSVVKEGSAPGTVSLYVRNPAGVSVKVGEG